MRSLAPFDRAVLDLDQSTICSVGPELDIRYVNPAWERFARENGATWAPGQFGVGTCLLDVIPLPLRAFYERLYARARTGTEIVEHDYECSSPTKFRRFRMRLLPCTAGDLLLVHSLRHEAPHDATPSPAAAASYRRADGFATQCSHCRRMRRLDDPSAWDWVPACVERVMPGTSHGLCQVCFAYHYPDPANLDPR